MDSKIIKPLKFSEYRLQNAIWLQQEWQKRKPSHRMLLNWNTNIIDYYTSYLQFTGYYPHELTIRLSHAGSLFRHYNSNQEVCKEIEANINEYIENIVNEYI